VQSVQTVPCPHCAEPVRPTATFCLACDRPIVDTERGLSVAEAVPASVGRPLVGLVVAVVCLLQLGGVAYGGIRIFRYGRNADADQAKSDVTHGLSLIVSAESGHIRACRALAPLLAEHAMITLAECHAVVGDDEGARVERVSVGTPHFATSVNGSAHLRATIIDAAGSHTIDEVVHLQEIQRHWRMVWNGKPVVTPQAA
jgi:hypothetical protein